MTDENTDIREQLKRKFAEVNDALASGEISLVAAVRLEREIEERLRGRDG